MTVMALVAPLVAGLGLASPALAKEPTGDFAVFKQCPRFTPGVVICVYGQIERGEVTLNRLTVPITHTITLQGGVAVNEALEDTWVGALDGETLSDTPQPVPGGLSSLINCDEIKDAGFPGRAWRGTCKAIFENRWSFKGANETTELARPANEIGINLSNVVNAEGTALVLPVRIHLESPLLGGKCYIGSSADPIMFDMTTGTTNPPPPNQPISGEVGNVQQKDGFNFVEAPGHSLVNNTFAAPEATGCGGPLSFLIDPLIDSKIGLPAPSGYNTVIHTGLADEGTAAGIIESEQEEPEPAGEKHHKHKGGHQTSPHRWWH